MEVITTGMGLVVWCLVLLQQTRGLTSVGRKLSIVDHNLPAHLKESSSVLVGDGVGDDYLSLFEFSQRKVRRRRPIEWTCPYYSEYSKIMKRPEYVCKEWKSFGKFREWMKMKNHVGRVLISSQNLPPYFSPETSFFVPPEVIDLNKHIGVRYNGKSTDPKYTVNIVKFGARKYLGTYSCAQDAWRVYNRARGMYMIELAGFLSDEEDAKLRMMLIDKAASILLENEPVVSRKGRAGTNKLVCGVGINDANYKIYTSMDINGRRSVYICPYYVKWKSMIERCYSPQFQRDIDSVYYGCTVSEEWKKFSNFKAWMEKQNWVGRNLEKNMIVSDNKARSLSLLSFFFLPFCL